MHLEDVPMPHVSDIPNGKGVLVKVLRVGLDGTDKEINDAQYGKAPPGADFLITGHESFGQVGGGARRNRAVPTRRLRRSKRSAAGAQRL